MIPPNTYTSPTHDTTQYIHESLGGIMSGTRVCIRWYRVGLMYVLGGIEQDTESRSIPPNTNTSPTHVTTQCIHESHSCYHPIHRRVPLMIPPNTYTSPAHDTSQYIQSSARYHPIHTRVPLMLPPNTYTSPAHAHVCIGWY
jgi:hypothetical protein